MIVISVSILSAVLILAPDTDRLPALIDGLMVTTKIVAATTDAMISKPVTMALSTHQYPVNGESHQTSRPLRCGIRDDMNPSPEDPSIDTVPRFNHVHTIPRSLELY